MCIEPYHCHSGFVQKQLPDGKRISNKTTLTLTLSRPTGEGTARPVSCSFKSRWIHLPTEDDSPSPIRWERAGVRVSVPHNPKSFLHAFLGERGHLGRCRSAPSPIGPVARAEVRPRENEYASGGGDGTPALP